MAAAWSVRIQSVQHAVDGKYDAGAIPADVILVDAALPATICRAGTTPTGSAAPRAIYSGIGNGVVTGIVYRNRDSCVPFSTLRFAGTGAHASNVHCSRRRWSTDGNGNRIATGGAGRVRRCSGDSVNPVTQGSAEAATSSDLPIDA